MHDKYKTAQARLNQYLASLKASGKTSEAKALVAQIGTTNTEPGISQKLDAAMEAGYNSMLTSHWDEAEANYKQAVDLAEKLQPHDERLATSLIRLGGIYAMKNNFAKTEAAFHQALDANVETYGVDSPRTTEPLQALGSYALNKEKDYKSALDYYSRALDVNIKTFGEASDKVADSLRFVASVYVAQGDYEKAESNLLRAVRINDSLFGQNQDGLQSLPLWLLCDLYDKWNKPDKAEPCYRHMLALLEKQYGTDSPALISTLTGEAKALHQLGRGEEALKVEQHMQSIRSASGQTVGTALAPQP